ncbi:MAG TPA: sigma-70 family RNA polymerase sigma factor [Hyphomicrobiaceae bacterium]|nr:sigma-70 family RNA polymerase sigma factor [Hyphomicrobiaceae bacterium]
MAGERTPEPDSRSRTDSPAEDAALLARLARGDPDTFATAVQRHLPHLLLLARRMLRDDAEAEDVAQEALIRLWRNADKLELGPGGLKPWLRRVVANLCIDRVRSSRNLTVTDEVPEQPVPAGQLRSIGDQQMARRVDEALKALPERQRLALVLFHFEGMSQVEVGNALGVSDEAVESLLSRARRSLKASLQGEWRNLLPDGEER